MMMMEDDESQPKQEDEGGEGGKFMLNTRTGESKDTISCCFNKWFNSQGPLLYVTALYGSTFFVSLECLQKARRGRLFDALLRYISWQPPYAEHVCLFFNRPFLQTLFVYAH